MELDKHRSNEYDVTHIKVREFVYTWSICNFKFYDFEKSDDEVCETSNKLVSTLFSPKFVTEDDDDCYSWGLMLFPSRHDEHDDEDYLSLRLGLTYVSKSKQVYVILSLLNENGEESNVSAEKQVKVEIGTWESRTFRKFVKRSYILDKKNGLLQNGRLTIRCKIYFNDGLVHCSHTIHPIEQPTNQTSQSRDFEQLLDDETFSDVKFVFEHNKELRAHKNILSARSRVFAAMFKHGMKESNENLVCIFDVDYDVMREVLRYIYAEKVNGIKPIAAELLIAADKYKLEGLKAMCENSLLVNLTLENVGKMLNLADRYRADALKKVALNYIADRAKNLANSNKFQAEMTSFSSSLSKEIIEVFMSKL